MGEVSSQLLLTIVGNDPEADPALLPSSPRYRQRCRPSALAHTDASLAPGTPSLPVAEPSLLLLSLARGALAGAIGDADPFDTFGLRRSLVLAGIEPGISGDKARYTSQFCCVHLDRRHQQIRFIGAPRRRNAPTRSVDRRVSSPRLAVDDDLLDQALGARGSHRPDAIRASTRTIATATTSFRSAIQR
jgi:hypothetical protein